MSNQWEQVKAAAERICIPSDDEWPVTGSDRFAHKKMALELARFALAAIPVIEAAEEAVGRIRYGVSREMGRDVVKILDTALAKLREG